MSKKRLYEIAKELGKESKEVVTRAKELGFDVKSHASSVDTDVAEKLIKSFSAKKETVEKKVAEVAAKTTAVAEEYCADWRPTLYTYVEMISLTVVLVPFCIR